MTETDPPTALDLPPVDPLPPEIQRYFDVCAERLGLVPNVLRAYASTSRSSTPSRGSTTI